MKFSSLSDIRALEPESEYNASNMKRLLLALACASIAIGATVTLTMDEVTLQAINGLPVTKGGITFTFSDAGGNLNYNSPGLGTFTYVQDPAIAGSPELFGVAFSVPVYSVQFGMAGNSTSIAPLATVRLYNGATLISTVTLTSSVTHTSPIATEEGQFTYSSATPVTSFTVTPTNTFAVIAFDNLTVTYTPSTPTVPATSSLTLALMTLGIVGLGGYALRRPFRPTTSH
jgi:hypothetical protein